MHQAADSIRVLDFVQVLFNHATDKNITGEKRFDDPHHSAPRRTLNPQLGMKHPQIQTLAHIRRRNVFMLRLCPGAIPGQWFSLHDQIAAATFPPLPRGGNGRYGCHVAFVLLTLLTRKFHCSQKRFVPGLSWVLGV
jgi:hypothetical protein